MKVQDFENETFNQYTRKTQCEIILGYTLGMKIEGEIIAINIKDKLNMKKMCFSLERKLKKKLISK